MMLDFIVIVIFTGVKSHCSFDLHFLMTKGFSLYYWPLYLLKGIISLIYLLDCVYQITNWQECFILYALTTNCLLFLMQRLNFMESHLLIFFFKIYFYSCVCMSAFWGHKRVLDFPLEMGLGQMWTTPCWCWEPNFLPLEEQQVLSTTLPSFHPLICLSSWIFPGQLESLLVLYLKVFSLYFLLVVAEFQV